VIKFAAMMSIKTLLFLNFVWSAPALAAVAQAPNGSESVPLMRMERQTRNEDVCILARSDGQYHLERVALGLGKSRVFEGSFPADSMSQLEHMLNVEIEMELVGEDLDQLLLAVNRPNGWQSLNFPTGKSRKPFRNSVDPLVKWLERSMQQPHPLPPGTPTTRCMPPQEGPSQTSSEAVPTLEGPTAASTAQAAKNPYLVRIIEDHYLADRTTASSGAWQQNINRKVERTCIIVYLSGRYRMEKSQQEFNAPMRTDVYHDSINDSQTHELEQLLNAADLVKLQHQTAAAGLIIKEGETVNLVIPRGAATQKLRFASYFGVRTQEVGLRDNLHAGVDAELPIVKPLRNWLKSNVENRKTAVEKSAPSTTCIPSIQPE
jgi:hypothetical protein